MAELVFNRYEKKYLLSEPEYRLLRARLSPFMQPDQYGQHTICNIYYDTENDLLIDRSVAGPVYKEKLRLRSYGVPTAETSVFLEIKKKYSGVVNKRRIQLQLREAYDYLERGLRPQQDSQILREIDFFLQRYPLTRRLFLAYDRVALSAREDSAFRVTFDKSIRTRRELPGLENGDWGEPLLPAGTYLMETKIMGATPLWFAKILSELRIYPVSFPKYGSLYKKERHAFDARQLLGSVCPNQTETGRKKVC